jgi:Rap1a immunity proteins
MRDIIEPLFKAKWAIVLTVAITLLRMPDGAMAQDSWGLETGNDYLRLCSTALEADASGRADGLVCRGYMRGFLSGLDATQDFYVTAGKQSRVLCLPATVNVDQLMRISLKYLDDHPAGLRGSLVQLILVSWVERFPCPKRP